MENEEDFTKLPLRERLSHKNWKARQSGYEELTRCEFDITVYNKILTDPNQIALETGLEAILKFLINTAKNARDDSISLNGMTTSILEQGLNVLCEKVLCSTRSTTRSKTIEILMMYAELGLAESLIVS